MFDLILSSLVLCLTVNDFIPKSSGVDCNFSMASLGLMRVVICIRSGPLVKSRVVFYGRAGKTSYSSS